MTKVAENISSLKSMLPPSVKLVAVSKTRPDKDIMDAYSAGQRCFGENRVQELLLKKDKLPPDIEWHLIGHLQSNKAKFIVPFVSMIQSVDSFKLLKIIDSEAAKINRIVDCLLQVFIAKEETKFGLSIEELNDIMELSDIRAMKHARICGLMGMATFTSDKDQVRREFSYLAECFNDMKKTYFENDTHFKELSMGMSGDYEIALTEGSTIIRIGSLIFGDRNKDQ